MALDTGRIRALCFDVDGTLSDTDDQWIARLEPFFRPFRFLYRKRDVRSFTRWVVMGLETPGNLMYHWLDHLALDFILARLYAAWLHLPHIRGRKHSFLAIPGTVEMIQELSKRYPLAVVSARDEDTTGDFLDRFNLRPYFTAVATSQTCFHTKPFPDPVIWAARQMGVAPEECLMIGDTVVDIRAGAAAGAQTVGVLCGFGSEKELRRAKADVILPSTHRLVEVLE